jgi:hypothetical protein
MAFVAWRVSQICCVEKRLFHATRQPLDGRSQQADQVLLGEVDPVPPRLAREYRDGMDQDEP